MLRNIDRVNRLEMSKPSSVAHYSRHNDLSLAELAALNSVKEVARGRSILDIGVGGGRTVLALTEISNNYLGIDNSAEMIGACQKRFVGRKFLELDARSMPNLPAASVHLAMFSCNGLGMVSHLDRLLILQEVFRLLEPGGVFLFSTHNRNSPDHAAGYQWPAFEASVNPARSLVRLLRFLKQVPLRWIRRQRFRSLEVHTPHYSVINDACHDYGVMLYYISLAEQRRQLEALGFESEALAYDLSGQRAKEESTDSSLMLVARKSSV